MAENERKEEAALVLPELERLYRGCEGRGTSGRFRECCMLCSGSGYETTEFGDKVLALLHHHFGPLFTNLISGE